MTNDTLDALETLDGYQRLFYDARFWKPYVQEVCRREGLDPCENVRIGVPGTCPVFIVEERWLVKFFGRLFNGGEAYEAEKEANRLAAQDPAIPLAPLLAWGRLEPGSAWPWPYLVFGFIPGQSVGELEDAIPAGEWLRIAADMGSYARRLHALPLEGTKVFPNRHEPYLAFLQAQRAGCAERHRAWGSLPARLVEQIDAFLPPAERLVDTARPPHLIHADLTRDHLLGRVVEGRWQSLALIDLGDAMTGNLLYELAALHLDLFRGEKRLLRAFLDAYGLPEEARAALPQKALATSLLHHFNVFEALSPDQLEAATLDELAERLWRV